MLIRCPHCPAPIRIPRSCTEPVLRFRCSGCGRVHNLAATALAAAGDDRSVVDFAELHGLDIPAARSALLGLVTPARTRPEREAPSEQRAERQPPDDPRQGPRSGERVPGLDIDWVVHRQASRKRPIVALAFVSALIVIAAAVGYWRWGQVTEQHRSTLTETRRSVASVDPPEEPRHEAGPREGQRPPGAIVRRAASGDVVEVVGSSPRAVLRAYCSALGQRFEALELAEAAPADDFTRIGLYRDLERPSELLALRLRRDWRTRRWAAGDGTSTVPMAHASRTRVGRQLLRLQPASRD